MGNAVLDALHGVGPNPTVLVLQEWLQLVQDLHAPERLTDPSGQGPAVDGPLRPGRLADEVQEQPPRLAAEPAGGLPGPLRTGVTTSSPC